MNETFIKASEKYLQQLKEKSNNILVVGPTGSGKTYCIYNLPPEQTIILNQENKELPYKNKFPFVYQFSTNPDMFLKQLTDCVKDSGAKYIFHDSFTQFSDDTYQIARETKAGYDIFNWYNEKLMLYFNTIKKFRNTFFIITARDEILKIDKPDGSSETRQRACVQGKDWEKRQIESMFTYVLYTHTPKNAQGGVDYKFWTNTNSYNGAKTPPKLGLALNIGNDIKFVCDQIEKNT